MHPRYTLVEPGVDPGAVTRFHMQKLLVNVWTVNDALPRDVCAEYARRLREGATEVAPIVGHGGGPEIDLAVRNNTRTMWDDVDEANGLLARVVAEVPPTLSGMKLAGANPRLRLYRYGPGERHGAHWDTVVELEGGVRSLLTLVFYLNDGFEGGETDFPELSRRIVPRLISCSASSSRRL